MSSPEWTDDYLIDELRAALAEAPADDSVTTAARAAFTWRTVDTELELLTLAAEQEPAAMVRDGGDEPPVTLTFRSGSVSVVVEASESGLFGQIIPARAGQIALVTAEGERFPADADEVGCFMLPLPPAGPARLECTAGGDHFVTEWAVF